MANYSSLKTNTINANVKENHNNTITGQVLQNVLNAMVNSLGAKFQFCGVATTLQNPGTPDYNVAYICGPGVYTNFGNKTVPSGYIGVLKYNGSWGVELIQLPVGSTVSVSPDLATGTKIATITVDGTDYDLYAPAGGGGDSYFEIVSNTVSLKVAYTGGITAPQGDITAPAGVVFGKSSGKITVGTGGDFNTLSDALAYASKYSRIFANIGDQLTIELKSTFSITEELVIDGIDLSYINITREAYTPPRPTTSNKRAYLNGTQSYPTVFVDLDDGDTLFSLLKGARGPRISCIFSATKSKNITGLFLESGSQIVIDAFCGFVDFREMVVAAGGSIVNASDAIFRGGNNFIPNIEAKKGAIIDVYGGMFSRDDAGFVFSSIDGANIFASGALLKGDAADITMIAYAEDGRICSTLLDLIDTEIEAYCFAGEISISVDAVSATIGATVEHGGIIRVINGTAVPTSGTLNTISADGIIFG